MDNLEEIKIQVSQRLLQNHKKIILSVYQQMINKHNSFCGCNYCILLNDYINLKKYKSKILNTYIYSEDGNIHDYYNNHIVEFKNKIKELKLQKDKLKIINYV